MNMPSPGWNPEDHAWSAKTKRTQEQIAANDAPLSAADLPGAKRAALPRSVEPMLATLADEPPAGDQWTYELKWDGVRALCFLEKGKLRIDSRNGKRIEKQYPELAGLPSLVDAQSALLDGEIVVLDPEGRARFELIQPRISTAPSKSERCSRQTPPSLSYSTCFIWMATTFVACRLNQRKNLLERTVKWNDRVRLSQHFEADPASMIEAVRKMGMEGVIAKDRHSLYETRRSRRWVKVKVQNQQEFVIGGYTDGEREGFGVACSRCLGRETLAPCGTGRNRLRS